MRATFFGIEIGKSGLTMSQLGLDVTGHNIANVETKGYTRQRIISTAFDPFSTIGRALPVEQARVGYGVRLKILDQIRSAYLDRRFRMENTNNYYWTKRAESLSYMESFFDNISEETSINYSIARFFESMKVMAEDTVEGAPRKLVQSAGEHLVSSLQMTYAGLIELQEAQNEAVKITVDKINRIAEDIVELNKAIYGFEITGHLANDLRDKRNLLLDELSELVDIDYADIPDGTGFTVLNVWIGGRSNENLLVDHDKSRELGYRLVDNTIEGEAQVWQPCWIESYANIDGVELDIGNLRLRDAVPLINGYASEINRLNEEIRGLNALIADLESQGFGTGDAAYDAAVAARAQAATDRGVVIGNLIFDFPDLQVDDTFDSDNIVTITIEGIDTITGLASTVELVGQNGVTLVDDRGPGADFNPKGGELKAYIDMRDNSDPVGLPGIPRFIDMLNLLAQSLVQEVNRVHRQGWTDLPAGSVTGVNFFQGGVWLDESVILTWNPSGGASGDGCWEDMNGDEVNDPESAGYVFHNGVWTSSLTFSMITGKWEDVNGDEIFDPAEAGYSYEFDISTVTAKNISLSREVGGNEFAIAGSSEAIVRTGASNELQRGNNENMNALYDLFANNASSITVGSVVIGAFDSYATNIRSGVGIALEFAKSMTDTSLTLTLAAERQRTSVSGVSLDEEMTHLIKYQHAYSGAARVITAMDDALDRLINGTGRVGL